MPHGGCGLQHALALAMCCLKHATLQEHVERFSHEQSFPFSCQDGVHHTSGPDIASASSQGKLNAHAAQHAYLLQRSR